MKARKCTRRRQIKTEQIIVSRIFILFFFFLIRGQRRRPCTPLLVPLHKKKKTTYNKKLFQNIRAAALLFRGLVRRRQRFAFARCCYCKEVVVDAAVYFIVTVITGARDRLASHPQYPFGYRSARSSGYHHRGTEPIVVVSVYFSGCVFFHTSASKMFRRTRPRGFA